MGLFRSKKKVQERQKTNDELIADLIVILREVKGKLTNESNVVWTHYESASDLIFEIERFISCLLANDMAVLEEIYFAFLPTSTFQDVSINNGWGREYIEMSVRFDKVYAEIRNHNYLPK